MLGIHTYLYNYGYLEYACMMYDSFCGMIKPCESSGCKDFKGIIFLI